MQHFSIAFYSLLFLLGASACASVAGPADYKQDVKLIDNREHLAMFTDNTLVNGYGFKSVGEFEARYTFPCNGQNYTVELTSTNKGQRFQSSIISIKTAGHMLRPASVKVINAKLSNIDLIGPVGLKCQAEENKNEALYLIINGAYINAKEYHYSYKNFGFLLENKHFVAEKNHKTPPN